MPLDISSPNVGDSAPDFTLPQAGGELVHLDRLRGRAVVLVFYRGAW